MGSCFSSCVRAASSDSSKSSDQSASRSDGRYAASVAASFVPIDGPLTPMSRPRSLQNTPVSGHVDLPPADADDPNKSASSSTRSNDDDSSRSRCSWDSESSSSERSSLGNSSSGRHVQLPPGTPTRRSPLNNSDGFSFDCTGLDSIPIFDRSSSSGLDYGVLPKQQLPSFENDDDAGIPFHRPAAAAAVAIFGRNDHHQHNNSNHSGCVASRRSGNQWSLGDEVSMDFPAEFWSDSPKQSSLSTPKVSPTHSLDGRNNSCSGGSSNARFTLSQSSRDNNSRSLPFVEDEKVHGGAKNSSDGNSNASLRSSNNGSGPASTTLAAQDHQNDDDGHPHLIPDPSAPPQNLVAAGSLDRAVAAEEVAMRATTRTL